MHTRVLVVDDDRRMASTVSQALRLALPEWQVDAAYSGEEALSSLANKSYDLIVADVYMPGISGIELIQGVRYIDVQVPVILMTGYGSSSLREEAARLNVDHYVAKPFEIDALVSMACELLRTGEDSDA